MEKSDNSGYRKKLIVKEIDSFTDIIRLKIKEVLSVSGVRRIYTSLH